ncbi:hypothetical protein HK100_009139, partial [Physocladia obscura]
YQHASVARKTLRSYTNLVATFAKPKPVVTAAEMEQQQQQQVSATAFFSKDTTSQFSGGHDVRLASTSSVSSAYHLDDDFITVSEKLAKLSMAHASSNDSGSHARAKSVDSFIANREALEHLCNGLKTPLQARQQYQQASYESNIASPPDITFESYTAHYARRFSDFDRQQQVPMAAGRSDDMQEEIAGAKHRYSNFSSQNVTPQPPSFSNQFVVEQEPFSPSDRGSRRLSIVRFDVSPVPRSSFSTSGYGNESSSLFTPQANATKSFDTGGLSPFKLSVPFVNSDGLLQQQMQQEQQPLQQNYQRLQQQHWEQQNKTVELMSFKAPITPATTPNPAKSLNYATTSTQELIKEQQQHQQQQHQVNPENKSTKVNEITLALATSTTAKQAMEIEAHQKQEKQDEIKQDEEFSSGIVPEITTSPADSEYSFKNQPPRNSSKNNTIFPWPLSRQEMDALQIIPILARSDAQHDDDSSGSLSDSSASSSSSTATAAPIRMGPGLKTKKRSFVDQLVGMDDLEPVSPPRRNRGRNGEGANRMPKHKRRKAGAASAVMPVIPARNVAMLLGMTHAATFADAAAAAAAAATEKGSDSFYVNTVGKWNGMVVDAAGTFVVPECEENVIKQHSVAMLNPRYFENF